MVLKSQSDESEFARLMERASEGSEEAIWDLIHLYGPYIQRVVRRRLPDELRAKFDSVDFVQAAWASVFANRNELGRFAESGQFIGFVAAVVTNKVGMEVRRRMKGTKYNVWKEQPLSEKTQYQECGNSPTPSELAIAKDELSHLLRGRPNAHRRLIQMRIEGATVNEIAEELGCDERTVRRAIQRIRSEGKSDE